MGSIKNNIINQISCIFLFLLVFLVLTSAQNNNIAHIEQIGDFNEAIQSQTKTQTGSNIAEINQWDVNSNIAEQTQNGYNNKAKIIQENGFGNYASQTQMGSDNVGGNALLEDPETGNTHQQKEFGAYIMQKGNDCEATQLMEGNNNYSYIEQRGDEQKAKINQYGSDLKAVLIQTDTYMSNKMITITQERSQPSGAVDPRPVIIRME